MEESDSKTVYRIVKYDDTWTKVAQTDIKDVYVTAPFYGSNLTMDSYQEKLVVYSARERYKTGDGVNHQSNITFQINMKDMTPIYIGGQSPVNYVSHSFASYVRFDGNRIVYEVATDNYLMVGSSVSLTEKYGKSQAQNLFLGMIGVPSPGNIEPLVLGNTINWYFYNNVYQSLYDQDRAEFYSLQVD